MTPTRIALVMLAALPATAAAAALETLQDFLDRVKTYKADFRQELFDETGRSIERSGGTFYLSRPDRFRWSYVTPYRQEIVADGTRVWLYDAELEQVTVRTLGEALGSSPARLLSSNVPIREDFSVREVGPQDDLEWLELEPRDPESTFAALRVGFAGDSLRRMELQDSFGQNTRIEFTAVEENPRLPDSLFRFTPPAGVDVIREQD